MPSRPAPRAGTSNVPYQSRSGLSRPQGRFHGNSTRSSPSILPWAGAVRPAKRQLPKAVRLSRSGAPSVPGYWRTLSAQRLWPNGSSKGPLAGFQASARAMATGPKSWSGSRRRLHGALWKGDQTDRNEPPGGVKHTCGVGCGEVSWQLGAEMGTSSVFGAFDATQPSAFLAENGACPHSGTVRAGKWGQARRAAEPVPIARQPGRTRARLRNLNASPSFWLVEGIGNGRDSHR